MSELKTKQTEQSVKSFIGGLSDVQMRDDSMKLVDLMSAITKQPPKMWGNSIVGFGSYTYKYASGRTGEWFLTGFSPRKQNLTLYFMSGFDEMADLLEKLGKHKTGKSCLYIKQLSELHLPTLKKMIRFSAKHAEKYCANMQAHRTTQK